MNHEICFAFDYIVFGHGEDVVIVCAYVFKHIQWTEILLVEKLFRNEQYNVLGAKK